ncbi:MAG: DUF6567 family protein [Cytophagaceae bacterium]
MKRQIIFLLSFTAMATFFGCTNSGLHVSANNTQVVLTRANYNIVATSVRGQAQAGYLFGASMGMGMYTQAYALIPLSSNRALYKQAIEDLWGNFEENHGNPVGRRLALVNVRYDSDVLNLFFYTRPRVYIIADVVEFDE